MNFGATVRQSHSIILIDVEGRLTLSEGSALRQMLCDLVKKGHKKIVLNLQGVHYLDSSGIGHLVNSYNFIKKQGGELKTICLAPKVKEVIKATNLAGIFEDYGDEQTAVRSFT